MNAVAYESIMVGMHYIHRGPNNGVCEKGKFPKLTDLELGFSRDGFHWDRPDRRGFIVGSRTEGSWDRGYLHSTAGVFVVLDDQLVFPYMGTSGIAPSGTRGMYTGGSIGLATLRRDGFASMDAGEKAGTLTTRPVTFKGSHLFVNVFAHEGELRVEALDAAGKIVATSKPLTADTTRQRVEWSDRADLSAFAGQPVRFRYVDHALHFSHEEIEAHRQAEDLWQSLATASPARLVQAADGRARTAKIGRTEIEQQIQALLMPAAQALRSGDPQAQEPVRLLQNALTQLRQNVQPGLVYDNLLLQLNKQRSAGAKRA